MQKGERIRDNINRTESQPFYHPYLSQNEMEKKLEELDRWDETNVTLFVDKVAEPEELSVLQDRFIDLDEINYLAKRMDSFDT